MFHGRMLVTPTAILSLVGGIGCGAAVCQAQDASQTAITIYSTTRPGAVAPDLYRPVQGQSNLYGRPVPGYAVVRHLRALELEDGLNRLNFSNVAAYIDPTTVNFESLTDPDGTRVLEQSFQFDLVSAQKLMERYIDQRILELTRLTAQPNLPETELLSVLQEQKDLRAQKLEELPLVPSVVA